MEFQNNNSDWLNGSDDENEEEEVLDTVYLIMQKRIKEWKFDLRTGSRFRFYSCVLKSSTKIDAQRKRNEKEKDKNFYFKMWSREDGWTNEKIIKLLYRLKLEILDWLQD